MDALKKPPATLLDLPPDVILLVLPYLEVHDFLNLTAAHKALYNNYINESSYWSDATRNTFRVANQPVVQNDGERWRKLYKRLKTETRAYGWGSNSNNCLAQPTDDDESVHGLMRRRRRIHVSWPEEMLYPKDIGVISDMQCGGWSTSLLTSDGALRVSGVLDGGDIRQHTRTFATTLTYPSAFVQPEQRYDPSTAVKQYSQGRSHLLALSDSRRIWSWRNADRAAINIRFINHDTIEGRHSGRGTVKKVVAGWSKSAALIDGSGIVVWDPVGRDHDEPEITDTDAAIVLESAVVPDTNLSQNQSALGQVLNFIVLEGLILFNTDAGKVFVSQIIWNDRQQRMTYPVEIALGEDSVTDVQGTFRNLAIFTASGAVLTTTQDRLIDYISGSTDIVKPLLARIPALQNSQVIAIAFGDYHFHALHAPGHITSYGKEPQSCGALGLGGYASPEGRLRGIRHEGMQNPGMAGMRMRGDGTLVPHANQGGRRVWFEKEKREWIKFLTSGAADAEEAAERMRLSIGSVDYRAQGEVSEWIEQEGKDWEEKYRVRKDGDDDLPAYFALSVCAAGWHSGALVLVNEDLAGRITSAVELKEFDALAAAQYSDAPVLSMVQVMVSLYWLLYNAVCWFLGSEYRAHHQQRTLIVEDTGMHSNNPLTFGASPRPGWRYAWADDHFPRLRLSSGLEMPGTAPLNEWRYGQPIWDESIVPRQI